jgi:hypothetical protein
MEEYYKEGREGFEDKRTLSWLYFDFSKLIKLYTSVCAIYHMSGMAQ